MDITYPAASINIGFNFVAEETIADDSGNEGRVSATVSLMFGGSVGVGFHASLWGQGDLQLSGLVPKKATWSGKDYDPKNEKDMVFKPNPKEGGGEAEAMMGTKVYWLIKRWFRRKIADILVRVHLGSVDTKKKLMELSQKIHEDLNDASSDKDKDGGEESGGKAEVAVDHKGKNSEQKLFTTLQYLHYKFYDMVQQFTKVHKAELLKGNLEKWNKDVVNAAFRKVYMGRCDFGSMKSNNENPAALKKKSKEAGATVCSVTDPKLTRMKCRKVDPSWHTEFGQHPIDEKTTKAAMQLMCTMMKRGMLLDKPAGTGKGFQNLADSLKHQNAYPQLLLTKDSLKAAVPKIIRDELGKRREFTVKGTKATVSYIDRFSMEDPRIVVREAPMLARGIVLSYPPDRLQTELLDKVEAQQNLANKMTQDNSCDMKAEATLGGGVTIGTSIVGFCTPDSNPFQAETAKKKKWDQKKDSKQCELGVGVWQPLESSFSLVLGSGTFYLDYHRQGGPGNFKDSNWGMRVLLNPGAFSAITPLVLCPGAEKIRTFFRNLFTVVKSGGSDAPIATSIATTLSLTVAAKLLVPFFQTVNGLITGFVTELGKLAGLDKFAAELGKALGKMFKFDLLGKKGITITPDVQGYIGMEVNIATDPAEDEVSFSHEQYFGIKIAGIPGADVQGYLTFAMGVECKLGAVPKK